MKRLGQVTIFVILGLILLAVVIIFIAYKSSFYNKPFEQDNGKNEDVNNINYLIHTCADVSIKNSIENMYNNAITLSGSPTIQGYPVIFTDKKIYLMTEQQINENIKENLLQQIESCLKNAQNTTKFTINFEDIYVDVSLLNDSVRYDFGNIILEDDASKYKLSDSGEIKTKIGALRMAINVYLDSQMHDDYFEITNIYRQLNNSGFTTELEYLDDNRNLIKINIDNSVVMMVVKV